MRVSEIRVKRIRVNQGLGVPLNINIVVSCRRSKFCKAVKVAVYNN